MENRKRPISGSKSRSLILLWLATLMFTSGCGYIQSLFGIDDASQGKYVVDPQFEEFYQRLGGTETLGPAITPLYWEEFVKKQYVEAGLMVFDPLAVPNYSLAPLGQELGYSELGEDSANSPEGYSPYSVYEGFLTLYIQLGGEEVVGKPLSDVQFDAQKKRLEQPFENLGFFQLIEDDNTNVQLLAYGSIACDYNCPYSAPESAIIERESNLPEPFLSAVKYLGQPFAGNVLAGPHTAEDGNTEVIFENLVLYTDPNNPAKVVTRPIVEFIGFTPHAPVDRLETDLVIFFIVEGNLGYNIPLIFSEFLAEHGGLSIAGYPISELFKLEENVFRQCFTNLCLDYYQLREDSQKVVVSPLGSIYKAYTVRTDSDPRIMLVPEAPTELQLRIWEENAFITSQDQQVVYVSVYQDGVPVMGVEPMLTLTLPQGGQSVFRFPATDINGTTYITIPPVLATNGTLVFYDICVEHGQSGIACENDNFLIWGNR